MLGGGVGGTGRGLPPPVRGRDGGSSPHRVQQPRRFYTTATEKSDRTVKTSQHRSPGQISGEGKAMFSLGCNTCYVAFPYSPPNIFFAYYILI